MYIADSRRLTNAGAKKMIEAATAKAAERGAAITIAIVDAGWHLMLLERMEGGKFHTVHSATTKAACAASNRRMTTSQGAVGQPLDTAHAAPTMSRRTSTRTAGTRPIIRMGL